MTVVSPLLTFPSISWWLHIIHATELTLDVHEHFSKMSDRNRYRIGGSNNTVLLSIPLEKGRNQHTPMKDITIKNEYDWQVQHWRTLVSVYNRSPYFFHYEPSLQPLFETRYDNLAVFNRAALQWTLQQLKMNIPVKETGNYLPSYPADVTDMRRGFGPIAHPPYYQAFQDRIGFVADLSILDLLFSEGPRTTDWLRANAPG